MDFHFVKLRTNEGYITVIDMDRRARYLCFKEKEIAEKCKKQFSAFRAEYGIWPEMNLTRTSKQIHIPSKIKVRRAKEVERYLAVETLDRSQLDVLCRSTDSAFMYCHAFDMKISQDHRIDMIFSAQDIDGIYDLESVKNTLDFTYFLR